MGEDFAKAAELFRKATEPGHAKAQYDLGNCYYLGFEVAQDFEMASDWLRKAAEQGNTFAEN